MQSQTGASPPDHCEMQVAGIATHASAHDVYVRFKTKSNLFQKHNSTSAAQKQVTMMSLPCN